MRKQYIVNLVIVRARLPTLSARCLWLRCLMSGESMSTSDNSPRATTRPVRTITQGKIPQQPGRTHQSWLLQRASLTPCIIAGNDYALSHSRVEHVAPISFVAWTFAAFTTLPFPRTEMDASATNGASKSSWPNCFESNTGF